jgi:hypothetical protein
LDDRCFGPNEPPDVLPSLKPARHPVYRLAVADAESLSQHVIAHRLAADGFEDSLSEGSHGCIVSLTSSVGHPNKLLARSDELRPSAALGGRISPW